MFLKHLQGRGLSHLCGQLIPAPIFNLHLPRCNSNPFLLVLSLLPWPGEEMGIKPKSLELHLMHYISNPQHSSFPSLSPSRSWSDITQHWVCCEPCRHDSRHLGWWLLSNTSWCFSSYLACQHSASPSEQPTDSAVNKSSFNWYIFCHVISLVS